MLPDGTCSAHPGKPCCLAPGDSVWIYAQRTPGSVAEVVMGRVYNVTDTIWTRVPKWRIWFPVTKITDVRIATTNPPTAWTPQPCTDALDRPPAAALRLFPNALLEQLPESELGIPPRQAPIYQATQPRFQEQQHARATSAAMSPRPFAQPLPEPWQQQNPEFPRRGHNETPRHPPRPGIPPPLRPPNTIVAEQRFPIPGDIVWAILSDPKARRQSIEQCRVFTPGPVWWCKVLSRAQCWLPISDLRWIKPAQDLDQIPDFWETYGPEGFFPRISAIGANLVPSFLWNHIPDSEKPQSPADNPYIFEVPNAQFQCVCEPVQTPGTPFNERGGASPHTTPVQNMLPNQREVQRPDSLYTTQNPEYAGRSATDRSKQPTLTQDHRHDVGDAPSTDPAKTTTSTTERNTLSEPSNGCEANPTRTVVITPRELRASQAKQDKTPTQITPANAKTTAGESATTPTYATKETSATRTPATIAKDKGSPQPRQDGNPFAPGAQVWVMFKTKHDFRTLVQQGVVRLEGNPMWISTSGGLWINAPTEAVRKYNSSKPGVWKAQPAEQVVNKVPEETFYAFGRMQVGLTNADIAYPPYDENEKERPASGESVWALVANDTIIDPSIQQVPTIVKYGRCWKRGDSWDVHFRPEGYWLRFEHAEHMRWGTLVEPEKWSSKIPPPPLSNRGKMTGAYIDKLPISFQKDVNIFPTITLENLRTKADRALTTKSSDRHQTRSPPPRAPHMEQSREQFTKDQVQTDQAQIQGEPLMHTPNAVRARTDTPTQDNKKREEKRSKKDKRETSQQQEEAQEYSSTEILIRCAELTREKTLSQEGEENRHGKRPVREGSTERERQSNKNEQASKQTTRTDREQTNREGEPTEQAELAFEINEKGTNGECCIPDRTPSPAREQTKDPEKGNKDNTSDEEEENEPDMPTKEQIKEWTKLIADTASFWTTATIRAMGRKETLTRHQIRKATNHALGLDAKEQPRTQTEAEQEMVADCRHFAKQLDILHSPRAARAAVELMLGSDTPQEMTAENIWSIVGHLALAFNPCFNDTEIILFMRATRAVTTDIVKELNRLHDLRHAQQEEEETEPNDTIINDPTLCDKFVNGPQPEDRLTALCKKIEDTFLTGGEWQNKEMALANRRARMTSRFEGLRLISIIRDLLTPTTHWPDQTLAMLCKRDNALINIWERLHICHAVHDLTYNASVNFAQAVDRTPPNIQKDFKTLWEEASMKCPIEDEANAYNTKKATPTQKRKRPTGDSKPSDT